jgi:hypothetical protein
MLRGGNLLGDGEARAAGAGGAQRGGDGGSRGGFRLGLGGCWLRREGPCWGRRGFKRCHCTAVPTMRVPSKVRHHARNKCSAPGRSLRNHNISLPITHWRLSLSGVSTHDGIPPVVCKRALAHTYSILKHSR